MQYSLRFLVPFIFLILAISSCKKEVKTEVTVKQPAQNETIKYAKGFDIIQNENDKTLIIKSPFLNADEVVYTFTLGKMATSLKSKHIKTPVNTVVVTSTTHVPMLEMLGVEDRLKGFPNTDYISSEKTRNLIENGSVIELGNEENINTELLIAMKPDVIVAFSMNQSNKMFENIEKIGIPVLYNGEWLEETPLGRAEWIKFFGVLFGKEQKADSIFRHIEANYNKAKQLALNADYRPTVLSGGMYKDIWNLPAGESFEAAFLADANSNYLWKSSKGSGSLSLNIENVFEKGKNADFWISPSFYTSYEQLSNSNDLYTEFEAFKNRKIFSFVSNKGATGGIKYFELAPIRPDLVLKDLIKITHPELLPDYELEFFEPLK